SRGTQGERASGLSSPTAKRVFAAARLGRPPAAAWVGTDCVDPPRTVRRARRTVGRARPVATPPRPATAPAPRERTAHWCAQRWAATARAVPAPAAAPRPARAGEAAPSARPPVTSTRPTASVSARDPRAVWRAPDAASPPTAATGCATPPGTARAWQRGPPAPPSIEPEGAPAQGLPVEF